jgi:hypothetical protein
MSMPQTAKRGSALREAASQHEVNRKCEAIAEFVPDVVTPRLFHYWEESVCVEGPGA